MNKKELKNFDKQKARINYLSEALNDFIKKYPCLKQNTCHCVTCAGKHALSAAGSIK